MTREEWAKQVRIAMIEQGININQFTANTGLSRYSVYKALSNREVTQRVIDRISDTAGIERIEI